jgi:hypothetical protein
VDGAECEADAPVPPGALAEGWEIAVGLAVVVALAVADALDVVVGAGVTSTT